MRFKDKIRIATKIGSIALLSGILLLIATYSAASVGYILLGKTFAIIGMVTLTFAFVLLVFGVVGRSAHRWMWFNVLQRSALAMYGRTPSERFLHSFDSTFWRWWLHIDLEGHDRDGLL